MPNSRICWVKPNKLQAVFEKRFGLQSNNTGRSPRQRSRESYNATITERAERLGLGLKVDVYAWYFFILYLPSASGHLLNLLVFKTVNSLLSIVYGVRIAFYKDDG
ncbi:hypothetical protein D1872_232920 [compost metagenome]